MPDNEVALVLPEPGTLSLLEHDGQAARDYARKSLAAATETTLSHRARVPTLLVTGEHSPAGAFVLTDCLEELLPNVERVNIPDASHLMHEDNAPALNEAIVGFFGRQGEGPA